MKRIFLVLVSAVCIGAGGLVPVRGDAAPASRSIPPDLDQLSRSFEQLAARTAPAVVQIFATAYGPVERGAEGSEALVGRQLRGGSGVVLAPDGHIVTNAHVVEGARRVEVMVPLVGSPGASILKPVGRRVVARVVGVDGETDLAVLKIDGQNFPHLTLGDSERLRRGQLVLAFGSPLGLENSVTMGVVSAVARQLRPESPMVYIQTDTPINPGNSGGPLVSASGEVVGINTMIFSQSGGSEGIGFAAPSNIVRNVFDQIRATGRVRRGEIGVNAQTITPMMAAGLGLDREWGVILADVYPQGPAASAGLKAGDIVLAVDGKPMENGRQFDVNLYRRAPEQIIKLDVQRGRERLSVRAPVTERAQDPARFADLVRSEHSRIPQLGILGLEIGPELATMLPWLRQGGGVLVAARTLDATWFDSGLEPGDVIYSVNGRPTEGMEALREVAASLKGPAVLHINRRGQLSYLAFNLE